jgi:hypothetical protein
VLFSQVVVDLLPELGVGVDLMRHGNWPGEGIHVWRRLWRREREPCPSEGIRKSGVHALALCATPSRLEYSVALALQQHGQQSALRKGRG